MTNTTAQKIKEEILKKSTALIICIEDWYNRDTLHIYSFTQQQLEEDDDLSYILYGKKTYFQGDSKIAKALDRFYSNYEVDTLRKNRLDVYKQSLDLKNYGYAFEAYMQNEADMKYLGYKMDKKGVDGLLNHRYVQLKCSVINGSHSGYSTTNSRIELD